MSFDSWMYQLTIGDAVNPAAVPVNRTDPPGGTVALDGVTVAVTWFV